SGSTLTLAAATQVVQTFDALGRVTRRRVGGGETQYTYGPQNQIESARTPAGDEYDYLYDESGQRLAKVRRSDGKIALAYVGGGVHDGAGLTAPISVAGVHVGTLRRGAFTAHASDTRGTVLGAPRRRSGACVRASGPKYAR
ncbi:MAG: hypothetical protein IT381_02635, partial [Deltaproteobacteria bacterium]|nr:hypothetical protein [Deltaproteobacteria bacterium]